MLGLNPSSELNDLMDETNLRLCNFLLSENENNEPIKGYYLVNLSSVKKTNSYDLEESDFTKKHSEWLLSVLKDSVRKKMDVCLFYGRNVPNNSIYKKGLTNDIIEQLKAINNNGNLYLTVDSNVENKNSYDLFSHPRNAKIIIRKVSEEDLKHIGCS